MNVSRLHKHLARLDSADDQAQKEALRQLRTLEKSDWDGVPPNFAQAVLDTFHRQLRHDTKLAVGQKDIAFILNSMGPLSKASVSQLCDLLQDGVPDCVREAAAGALGKIGSKAKNAAGRLAQLASGPSALARQALAALGAIGCADQPVKNILVDLWRAPAHSYDASVQLARTLSKLQIEVDGLSKLLIGALLDGQTEGIRLAAVDGLALRDKNECDVVPALMLSHITDKSENVRGAALAACVQVCSSHENAIQLCARQLKGAIHAEVALRKTGAATVPALIAALAASDADTRLKAMRILSSFGEAAANAADALAKGLRDRNPEIRLAAAKCLWNVNKNTDAVVPVLVQLLEDKQSAPRGNEEARRMYLQTVIEALSRIGPPAARAVPAISAKVKDQNRLISQSASEALKKIQTAGAK